MLDLVALHRLSQLVCPAVCVEHVHDLQGDSATVHRAACIAKLTKLAAVKGPILAPSQEDVDYVNHAHTKIIMLQVQVLSCKCPSLHGSLHDITELYINTVLDMGHYHVADNTMNAQTVPSWPSAELCVQHLRKSCLSCFMGGAVAK